MLVRDDSERAPFQNVDAVTSKDDHQQVTAGGLVLRHEHRDDVLIIWLGGRLDRSAAASLDRELNASSATITQVIIDMRGLSVIEFGALDWLRAIQRHAFERGDRLSLRSGLQVVQWPPALTSAAPVRHCAGTGPLNDVNDDPYLALALACADVDHPHCGDRPWRA